MVNKDTQRKIVDGTIYNHRNALKRLQQFCSDNNLSKNWTARISWEYTGTNTGAGAGATSATPIYLGLMAIAGSILLKKGSEK